MIELYPQIKHLHILMVTLSGTLFAMRGAGVLLHGRWPMSRLARWASYAIDTTLLTTALMLLTILPWTAFSNGWLAVKLTLLVAYIVLGTFALKRARSMRTRAILFALALLTYGWMITSARAHHPMGIFATLH